MKYLQKDTKLLNRFVLSPKNILITDNMDAKLNLGQCAYSFQDKNKIVDPQFYSSEALNHRTGAFDKYNSDIWSYGILLSELFSETLPDYDNMNHMHIGYRISVLKEAPRYEIHEAQIEKIVQLCLNPISSKRPQFQQLIPILNKIKENLYEK
uniref:Integrin-linked protein kinase (Trinotate prediction) n=1 Tax=Myxobolus squamalis TaxID=59785 RepID=A0A6B2FZB6_MYXSQ